MCGSGVQICSVPIQLVHRMTPLVHLHRPITPVVFAAVRGSTSIRTASGALFVAGSSQFSGTASSASVFPQDLVRILFSGAAIGSPFASSVVLQRKTTSHRRFGTERVMLACGNYELTFERQPQFLIRLPNLPRPHPLVVRRLANP